MSYCSLQLSVISDVAVTSLTESPHSRVVFSHLNCSVSSDELVTEVDADLGNGVVARQYQGANNVVPPICNRDQVH